MKERSIEIVDDNSEVVMKMYAEPVEVGGATLAMYHKGKPKLELSSREGIILNRHVNIGNDKGNRADQGASSGNNKGKGPIEKEKDLGGQTPKGSAS